MLLNLNEFLLGVAGVASTLIGTFIVGVFFYIDTDLHRMMMSSDAADRYLRSGVRWVFIIYTLPLFMSLALAAFEPAWGAATFIALGLLVVLTTIDTGWRMLKRGGSGNSMALVVNQCVHGSRRCHHGASVDHRRMGAARDGVHPVTSHRPRCGLRQHGGTDHDAVRRDRSNGRFARG